MKRENIFLKIWRVIYPVGIYFLISTIISTGFVIMKTISLQMAMMKGQGSVDMVALQSVILDEVYKSAMTMTAIAALITIPIAYLLFRNDRKKEQIKYDKVNASFYGFIILVAISACLGGNQLLTITRLDEVFPGINNVQEALYGGSVFMQILAAVILAPIVEELLFRGLVFKRLEGYIGKIAAMILSSLFFGVYHGNVVQGVYAFLLGMVFVLIYDSYKTLAAPIVAHIIANLTSVLSKGTGVFDVLYESDIYFYSSTVVAILICIGLIVVIRKKVVRNELIEG